MDSLIELEDLQARYQALINQALPDLAKHSALPIRLNHYFARVVLDNLFGCCWYDVLDRHGQPAYRQLTAAQLMDAIAIAENMVNHPQIIHDLNQNSLRWRGKLKSCD